MTQTERLLTILNLLKQNRFPVPAKRLASLLEVSIRTIYRDIVTLNSKGADIRGEAGIGYFLYKDPDLPPLSFTEDETEALFFAVRLLMQSPEKIPAAHGKVIFGKLSEHFPEYARRRESLPAILPVWPDNNTSSFYFKCIHQAVREERPVSVRYRDGTGKESERTICPLLIGYFESARVLAAWCMLRQDFRHFRLDRITGITPASGLFPKSRSALLQQWQRQQKIHIL